MASIRRGSHILAIAAAVALLAVPSQAYYHYVHFLSKAPYLPIPEAFDLNALPNKTLTFFVSDSGLAAYGPNDSFGSVLSQVKQAAAAWNSIASSDLRVQFGGLETLNPSQNYNTPGADVVFMELPPGLLGYGAPTVSISATVQTGQNGQFIPIARGVVTLSNTTDPNARYGPGPSYLEEFYTTAVHEFGHALGLQHTWTAAAMSQDVIRNTSRARPLDADDIAAISELYGTANWTANTGSISGHVTANGQGWNLASVVAIPPIGPAVSTLTNPDGSYSIKGLPPGQYLLYVHPLPPDAAPSDGTGLKLPVDANGRPFIPSSPYFQTVFYPGTTDYTQATTFTVAAGDTVTGQDFKVQLRNSIPTYDLVTWTWLDASSRTYAYTADPASRLLVTPAYGTTTQQYLRVLVEANYATSTPLPKTAALLGPGFAASGDIQNYNPFILMDFLNQGGVAAGPRHLVLTFNTSQGTDLFVVPDAVTVVNNGPPAINTLTENSDGSITVSGAGLTPDSRVFFDGLQATPIAPFAATDAVNGTITVTPPEGASGQVSTATVFTADNQNSMMLQGGSPVTFTYPAASLPQFNAIVPSSLPAGYNADGTSAMVDITTANTNFVEGHVTVGFGTTDIAVRRVWVLGATHLVADVIVANNAAIAAYPVNIISGFQVISAPGALQIGPANSNLPTPALPIYNALSYATVLHDADYGTIFGANLAATPTGAQVFLNGTAIPVLYGSANQINFQIPATFPSGPATLTLNNGSTNSLPVFVQIDSPPAVINVPAGTPNGASLLNASGMAVQTVNPGDVVSLQVTNVDPSIVNSTGRVRVTLSGVPMSVLSVSAVSSTVFQVQFAITQSFAGWQVPLVVSVDGSPSLAIQVTAR